MTVTPIPWSSDLMTLAHRYAKRTAVSDDTRSITYTDFCAEAHAFAQVLRSARDRAPIRIGVLLGNGIPAVIADYAISLIGACVVHLNSAYSAADIAWCAKIAPFDLLVTERELLEHVSGLDVQTVLINNGPAHGPSEAVAALPAVAGNQESRVIFTSGSSGKPKAVVYTHQKRWLAATVLRSVLPYRPGRAGGIALMTPYVHGASNLARAYLDCGGHVSLMGGVNLARLEAELQSGRVDALFAPPSVLAKIVDTFEDLSFPEVQCVYTGTQPLHVGTYSKAAKIFGPSLRITYGKSENLNPITVLEPDEAAEVYAQVDQTIGFCVGYPGPGVEVTLSEAGEILLRSQHGYDGYHTEDGFDSHKHGEWHATDDRGYFDERGRLWLSGRSSDVINTGGYMVNPDDIESALSSVDAVQELCVLGLPSTYWTEIIVCVYVAPDTSFDPSRGFALALENMTKYKRPRLYASVDSISRTFAGKINRRAVCEQLLSCYVLVDGPHPSLVNINVAAQARLAEKGFEDG